MRVLHAIDGLSIGGAERHVVDLARRQVERGDEVAVACSSAGPLAADLDAAGVPVHVLCDGLVKRRLDLRYARALRGLIAGSPPDLVHAHLYASIVAAAAATLGTGVPLVATEQTEAPWRGRRARLASRLAYRRAEHLVAVSHSIRGTLVEAFGVPEEKVTTIPNAVALPQPARAGDPMPWSGRPVVGVCARLVPEKGLDVFLEAAALLTRKFPDACFPVVGDGPLREELEARAADLGLGARVGFAGFRDDCRALMGRFDVLAVPSRSEGTPLTIVEAMHAGVPVVATRVGGIPEQIDDGRTGLLVEPEDAAALAGALARALDQQVGPRLAATGRRQAMTEFHPQTMLRRIDGVYERAVPRTADQPSPHGPAAPATA